MKRLLAFAVGSSLLIGASTPVFAEEGAEKEFIRGADTSLLPKVERGGGVFTVDGQPSDALEILEYHGADYIRLKIWKDPINVGGANDLEETVAMAERVRETDMKLLLNFHYSDFWADPGRQDKPKAWEDLSFDELTQAVYDHTYETLTALEEVDAFPEMIQVGNEIQGGLLWPDGKAYGDVLGEDYGGFDNIVTLLQAGIDAIHDATPAGADPEIMLHLADGGDNGLYQWWFDEVTSRGLADFDIIGLSYYPYWHGSLEDLRTNLHDISERYDRDVLVVETAYGFTLDDGDGHENIFSAEDAEIAGYPVSPEGQLAFVRDLEAVIQSVPNDRGRGFFYWEPTWIPSENAGWRDGEGNAWENQALFDFNGEALSSLAMFGEPANDGGEEVISFNDVDGDTIGYEAIMQLAQDRVITGFVDGSFQPAASVSRLHAGLMLARELQLDVDSLVAMSLFRDISEDHPYASQVQAFYDAGIVRGTTNGDFLPQTSVTRGELAAMLVRGYEVEADGEEGDSNIRNHLFTDVYGSPYESYIDTLYQSGVVAGVAVDRFEPNRPVTRAELAILLMRLRGVDL
ncbi:glycosyl hydrolase 53 family protein [Paenalkalicoccus suaedae]|uniref:Arabinogalactan endo-beta-1,4-galactanase n=1 Tax=Paenalkalicoccus suaedae TaxID=2592382 RepID=A0A859FJJ5_9BACI|nr:glycosyl hydrolase 53 family protein [Paenalkalicoccus suaedae]QKS72981.1 glycosyl hydrolase 53 family protein [Paenalkalicoccus suaedae]